MAISVVQSRGFATLSSLPRRANDVDIRVRNLADQVQLLQDEMNAIHHEGDLMVNKITILKNNAIRMSSEAKALRMACGGVSGIAVAVTYSAVKGITGPKVITCAALGAVGGIGVGYVYDKFMGENE